MRKITILERLSDGAEAMVFHVVFWFATPTGREAYYADPSFASVMTGQTAPTPQELAALRDGTVIEMEDNVSLDKKDANGVPLDQNAFYAAAATTLSALYAALEAQVDITNPHILFNTRFSDEAGWVVQSLP